MLTGKSIVLYCIAAVLPFLVFLGFIAAVIFLKRNSEVNKNNLNKYKKALIILRVFIGIMAAIAVGLIIMLIYTITKTPEPLDFGI